MFVEGFCSVMFCSVVLCSVVSCSGVSCSAMLVFCSVVLCSVMFCSVMLYSVVFVEGARRDTRGILGATWGLAAAVCRVGVAGRSVLKT